MAIIDNTLAAQVPTFDAATPLKEVAQLQAAQQELLQAKYKQNQTEMGAEMRGLAPFVNSPEFPAKWREAADKLRQRGVIDDQMHDQWANAPSPLLMKSIIAKTDSPEMAYNKDRAIQADKNTAFNQGIALRTANRLEEGPLEQAGQRAQAAEKYGLVKGTPDYQAFVLGGTLPESPEHSAAMAKAKGDNPTIIGAGSSVIIPNKASEGAIFTNKSGAGIDDETADFLAKRSLQGDTRALVGLGRGAQGAENILKIQQRATAIAKDQGIDASEVLANIATQAGVTSEARALGTKSAHFGVAEKAMEESLPIALAASKEVPRTQWKALTELIQKGETQINDPKLKKFLIATDTAAKDYARTINPSGQTREGDIAYARKLISTADSAEAYEAALQQLKVEAGVTKRAIQRQKDEVRTGGKSEASHGKAVKEPVTIGGYTIREN